MTFGGKRRTSTLDTSATIATGAALCWLELGAPLPVSVASVLEPPASGVTPTAD